MNSRHPDPRREGKGGPEQRVMTSLLGIWRAAKGSVGVFLDAFFLCTGIVIQQHLLRKWGRKIG